jgi:hypothetical protein
MVSTDYENNKHHLNRALRDIGIKKCLLFFSDFLSSFDDNLTIISVGSGTAYFEYLIQTLFNRTIVCVDPEPRSYSNLTTKEILEGKKNSTVFIVPKYNTVNIKLLQSKNYTDGKYKDSLLILNWSNPMFKNNNGYDPYDFNAIIKLKPIGFFIVYEIEGGSGSEDMRETLSHDFFNPTFKISEEETISYKLLNNMDKDIPKTKQTSWNVFLRIAYYKKVRNISTLFNNNIFFGNN